MNYLKDYRMRAGLSLRALGDAVGLTATSIKKYEDGGSPRLDRAYKIAAILNCEVEDIWPNEVEIRVEEVIVEKRIAVTSHG